VRVGTIRQVGQHATGATETRLSGYDSPRLNQTLLRNHPATNKKPSPRRLTRCIVGLFPLHSRRVMDDSSLSEHHLW
jgi:hypothetical protein